MQCLLKKIKINKTNPKRPSVNRQVMRGWHKATQRQIPRKQDHLTFRHVRTGKREICSQGCVDSRWDTKMRWLTVSYLCLVFLDSVPPAVPPLKWLSVRCHDTVHLQKLVYLTKTSTGPTSITPQPQELRVKCLLFNCTDGPMRSGTYSATCLKDALMVRVRFIIFCTFTRMHPQLITRSGWASQIRLSY